MPYDLNDDYQVVVFFTKLLNISRYYMQIYNYINVEM